MMTAAASAAAAGRWAAAPGALPRCQQLQRRRRRRRFSVGVLRSEAPRYFDDPVGPSSARSGHAAPATALLAHTVRMAEGGDVGSGSGRDSGSGGGPFHATSAGSSVDGVVALRRRPSREVSSAVRLTAHRSSGVAATEARPGVVGRVGTRRPNRPGGGGGRGGRSGSYGGSGLGGGNRPKPRAIKKERATVKKSAPPGVTDWRNAELDGKSRSFLFVKEVKAIPKWNGAKVLRLLKEAQRVRSSFVPQPGTKQLEMTSFMYNACISHMSMCGRWEEALQVLDLMRTWECPPDEFCVTAAITACGRAGKWQESLDVRERRERDRGGAGGGLGGYCLLLFRFLARCFFLPHQRP